ncbi:MAG: O-antigen ligase family protein [bacterium]|nr:O-antigen ligase family protein [bacterium]
MILITTTLFLFFALAIYRLYWALWLTAFALPAYLIRFEVFGWPFTLLEGFILAVVLAWAIRLTLTNKWRSVRFPGIWLIGVFAIAATLAVFVSPETRAAWGIWKAYFVEPILLYLVIANEARSTSVRRGLVYALGLSVIVIGCYAAGQYLGWWTSPEPWISESPKRVTSIFGYPNAVGLFVTPIIGLFLGLLALKQRAWPHWFSILVLITGLWSLFASVTRGAAIGLIAALIFLAVFSQRRRWVWLMVVLLTATILLTPGIRNQARDIAVGEDTSTDVRLVLWQGTWDLLKARPFLGSGLAGFPTVYDEYRQAKHTELLLYPHNIFLNFWTETGLLGLLAIVILLAWFFYHGAAARRKPDSVLAFGLLTAMTALVFYGLVEAPYFKNDLSAQFWILFGLMAAIAQMDEGSGRSLTHEDIQRLRKHSVR